ncbi:energy transducer TonB [Rubrivirga sp.]|uniref:energy transducer TonB n=1 Tax=Rubrivirga sp. TaxID=1885344 RepID=UPI003C785DAB
MGYCGCCPDRSRPLPLTGVSAAAFAPESVASLGYDWHLLASAVEYPEFARRAYIEGVVRVEAVVDTTGRVTAARSLSRSNELLVEAALAGVRQAEFFPAPPFIDFVEVAVEFRLR